MKKIILFTYLTTLCWLLIGCSTAAKVWKPYDNIDITANNNVNPDGKGLASPIQLKIYELSSRSTFDNLDFERAYHNAKTLLSDELISEAVITLQPNESLRHTVNLTKDTGFIAVIAGFINIDNTRWKHVYKVNPFGHYNHKLTINDKGIIEGITKEETKPEQESEPNL